MRVQVNLSDNMVERVDNLAKNYGVSRSSLCSMAIGQFVMGVEQSISILEKSGYEYLKTLDDNVVDK